MDESTSLGVRRKVTGSGVSQTFDDGGFSRTILANNECQWFVEGDGLTFGIIERTDSLNGKLS